MFLPKYLENHFGIARYLVHRYMGTVVIDFSSSVNFPENDILVHGYGSHLLYVVIRAVKHEECVSSFSLFFKRKEKASSEKTP